MPKGKVDPKILDIAATLSGRAKLVCDLIIKEGTVTTADLEAHGYKHPPRAIADVREAGIPIVMTMTTNPSNNRRMASYGFGDPAAIREGRLEGRVTFRKGLKDELAAKDGSRCALCSHDYALNHLQIDHRVPYRVGGEPDSDDGFMLVCRSCQRAKSWACEHCPNWTRLDGATCTSCFWASPQRYDHVATVDERRLLIVFSGEETKLCDTAVRNAKKRGVEAAEYIKALLREKG